MTEEEAVAAREESERLRIQAEARLALQLLSSPPPGARGNQRWSRSQQGQLGNAVLKRCHLRAEVTGLRLPDGGEYADAGWARPPHRNFPEDRAQTRPAALTPEGVRRLLHAHPGGRAGAQEVNACRPPLVAGFKGEPGSGGHPSSRTRDVGNSDKLVMFPDSCPPSQAFSGPSWTPRSRSHGHKDPGGLYPNEGTAQTKSR